MRRVFLITIDGWGTNLVGAYGNPLCETPNLDEIAARSTVFDRAWTNSLDLDEVLESISLGRHPLGADAAQPIHLGELLRNRGMRSCFLSDDTMLEEADWLRSFDQVVVPNFEDSTQDDQAAIPIEWTETKTAHFIEWAMGYLSELAEAPGGVPEFVWLHLSGLTLHWDAPYEFRRRLCDPESDPEPSRTLVPIALEVDETTDPDSIFQATCVAAAQGCVIDHVFEWIEAAIESVFDREACLLIVTGARGYPLGEHRSVGFARHRPYAEAVHIPLIIRHGSPALGSRDPDPVQLHTLRSKFLQWMAGEQASSDVIEPNTPTEAAVVGSGGLSDVGHEANFVVSPEAFAIQAGRWSLVAKADLLEPSVEPLDDRQLGVFLSPDDRWQQNNVASRVEDVSEAMLELARARRARYQTETRPSPPPSIAPCLTRSVS